MEELYFDQVPDAVSKGILGLCSDASAGLFYAYDQNSIFQVQLVWICFWVFCVWPDPVLLKVHLLPMNSNSGISKWWRSRHVEGLLRPKGICCCFSKLSWCPSKRPCLSSAGLIILNLFTFSIFEQTANKSRSMPLHLDLSWWFHGWMLRFY